MNNDLLLVIDHRETLVRMEGRALRIDHPDAAPEHVPLGLVGLVVVPGRESLVLDLMEPLRPSVDCLVIGLLDDTLLPTQFTYSARDGCRLNKGGRAQFYREWAIARSDWPDLHGTDATAGVEPSAESGEAGPSLPALCRRQVEHLRGQLRPFLPGEAADG